MQNVIITLEGKELILETGVLAPQARGSVVAKMGDTVVLAAVTASTKRSDKGFFPLSIEYLERLYAGGRISSSRFVKREGRPSEDSVLNGRLIDRALRPLFPKGFANDVQIAVTVLSVDGVNDPALLGLIASSAALHISDIPWNGPVAGVKVGLFGEGLVINPDESKMEESRLDLVVAGDKDRVMMVESGASEVGEDLILKSFDMVFGPLQVICEGIEKLRSLVGKDKFTYDAVEVDDLIMNEIEKVVASKVDEILSLIASKKMNKEDAMSDVKQEVMVAFRDKEGYSAEVVSQVVDSIFKAKVRERVLGKGVRVDGRGKDDVRELDIMVGLLPRVHGSAMFRRGMTQTLTAVTLGSPALEQLLESAIGEDTKRYMHHYNFPPYSVGEVGRYSSPGRREIGHGHLAERALVPVIPDEETFPYAIRVVNEIMSSNGSSSMASVCGSTLALMDAGVPIKRPVSGIAMGLMLDKDSGKYVVLTDIAGIEDATGDMDFKVAGTVEGITALQMDIKIDGVSREILADALSAARKARLYILEAMLAVISEPRSERSAYAPRVTRMEIPPEMIGMVIGSGGKTVNQIIKECGVTVDIEDDGVVMISGTDSDGVEKAKKMIDTITHEVKVGDIYEGVVRRIVPFGAFVELVPGKEGLVHISQLAPQRVGKVEDVVNIGDAVMVRVIEIDEERRINLTLDVNNTWVREGVSDRDSIGERRNGGGRNGRGGRRGEW